MLKKIFTNSFLGNILKVASGSIISQVIGFLILPIITRIYSPEHFGEFAVLISIFAVLSPLMGGKYEIAIVLEKNINNKSSLYLISTIITLFLSLLLFFIFYFTGDFIINYLNIKITKNLFFSIPILLLIFGILQANKFILTSNNNFGVLSKIIVFDKLINTSSRLVFGIIKPSGFGLIISEFISKTIVVLYSTFMVCKNKLVILKKLDCIYLLKKYKNFPTYELISDWFDSISNSLPLLLLAYYFEDTILGYFSFTLFTLKIFINIFSKSVSSVYYQKISHMDLEKRKGFTLRLNDSLCLISVFPFLLLILGAPEIFSLVFGKEWYEAGSYAQILAPYLFFVFLLKPVVSLYRVYSKQKILLYFNIINLIMFSLATITGGYLESIYLTLGLISLSGVIIYGLIYFWILNLIKITIIDFFNSFKRYFVTSFLFLIFPILMKIFLKEDIYFLICLFVVFILYCLLMYPKIKKTYLLKND
jgi:O-antigen/teichoic acid export membrane protein